MTNCTLASSVYKLNIEPRLSANQLSEYLSASAYRRTAIVRDAKYPKTTIVARYRDARLAIARALCAGPGAPDHIAHAIQRLTRRTEGPDAGPWTIEDCRLSISLLEGFSRNRGNLGLNRFAFRPTSGGFPHLDIAGVAVNVSLCATVHQRKRDGVERVGGLVMMTSRDVSADEAAISALLCYMLARAHLGHLGLAESKLSLALDVSGSQLVSAPKAHTRRYREMVHACAEIARAWPTAEPPTGYDGDDIA